MVHLVQVATPEDLSHVRRLFREYAESIGIDLAFQNFEEEFAGLPGSYAPPGGCLLLAFVEKLAVGCVALQRVSERVCEMKRLYVQPPFRREGIGRKLVLRLIEIARHAGYHRMLLDTIPPMKEATSLYRSFGFKEIDPYRFNPVEGAIFMELAL